MSSRVAKKSVKSCSSVDKKLKTSLCERQDFLLLSTDLPDFPDAERRTKIIIYDHLRSLLKPPLSRETYF